MSGTAKRALGATIVAVLICAAIGVYVGLYLINVPGSAAATPTANGDQLYIATVPATEPTDPHPTWVSYYDVNSTSGDWRHVTTYVAPANTLVHVTVYQYDGPSSLRNPYFGEVSGTVGGTFVVDGQTRRSISWGAASHVFSIPQIGLSVPLPGVDPNAKNSCPNAPCSLSMAHRTIQFTFRTPGKGLYRWQCFVPCAAGFIDGFGGPMQTEGYMDGYLKVV